MYVNVWFVADVLKLKSRHFIGGFLKFDLNVSYLISGCGGGTFDDPDSSALATR
jgi:hypothetical protein